MRVTLKYSNQVLIVIPRFDRFLNTGNLRIIERVDDPARGIIELVINARIYGSIKWAAKLAQDCFDKELVNIDAGMEIALPPCQPTSPG